MKFKNKEINFTQLLLDSIDQILRSISFEKLDVNAYNDSDWLRLDKQAHNLVTKVDIKIDFRKDGIFISITPKAAHSKIRFFKDLAKYVLNYELTH